MLCYSWCQILMFYHNNLSRVLSNKCSSLRLEYSCAASCWYIRIWLQRLGAFHVFHDRFWEDQRIHLCAQRVLVVSQLKTTNYFARASWINQFYQSSSKYRSTSGNSDFAGLLKLPQVKGRRSILESVVWAESSKTFVNESPVPHSEITGCVLHVWLIAMTMVASFEFIVWLSYKDRIARLTWQFYYWKCHESDQITINRRSRRMVRNCISNRLLWRHMCSRHALYCPAWYNNTDSSYCFYFFICGLAASVSRVTSAQPQVSFHKLSAAIVSSIIEKLLYVQCPYRHLIAVMDGKYIATTSVQVLAPAP